MRRDNSTQIFFLISSTQKQNFEANVEKLQLKVQLLDDWNQFLFTLYLLCKYYLYLLFTSIWFYFGIKAY